MSKKIAKVLEITRELHLNSEEYCQLGHIFMVHSELMSAMKPLDALLGDMYPEKPKEFKLGSKLEFND